ncbi:senescence-specific cysteine protease SAG39-like [Vigna unguiculata]|uniref:senescence-specific cysteine protease SAG39-like n=1 Tax=Vigna unguiculata TaxID=3917 RepID=UPI00101717F0|nr:senescence-specific cysteine protease SAG39-like [Vigna unguiculata]
MSSFSQNNHVLVLFLVFTVWTCHVMSRRLPEATSSERHEKWMAQYGKVYKDAAEKEKRFQIFNKNVQFIESFNAAGHKSFNLSINQFADLHNEEFKALLINGQKNAHRVGTVTETSFRYDNITKVPATMDWRKRGAVTPIKNQGRCGSCWAFSTVASIESLHQITTGELVSLSEQELVDCVEGNSEGCNGGYMEDAFEFVAKKGGLASEEYYPYKANNKTCKVKKEGHGVAEIKGYEKVAANSEKALLKAVAHQPVSVYIDAGDSAFQFYSSGIFSGKCGTHLNHAVAVVGYGKDRGGGKYWIVKNSWSTEWGEKGYMRMKRDIRAKEGLCGIATHAAYPFA